MVCNPTTTLALVMVIVIVVVASASASDEDEALASLLRTNPRAAAMAEAVAAAAAAAAAADARAAGSLAAWEPAQPDPRWYLLTEADALLQEAGLARRRERQGTTAAAAAHRATSPSLSMSMDSNTEDDRRRPAEHKRAGPSLSIVNPLDVLRQRILLEIARRRIKQSEGQIQANRDLLRVIGKRGRWQ